MNTAVALITGANRGVGRALAEALLSRGATKVYVAARTPSTLAPVLAVDPDRLHAIHLDLTDLGSVEAAAAAAPDITLLVNNAAVMQQSFTLDSERGVLIEQLMTNTVGTADVIRAFAPVISASGGGRIVNVMSLQSLAGSTGFDGYSASKAGLHSLTQSLRPALRGLGIAISGVYPGGIDTDMLREFDTLKSSARAVAEGILDGVAAGQDDIFPDPVAQLAGEIYRADPKRFERLFAEPEQLVAMLEAARDEGRLELV